MPKTQEQLTEADVVFDPGAIGEWSLDLAAFENPIEGISASLKYIENLSDRVSRGNLVARVRQDWVPANLTDAEVEALDGGFLYYDKDTFPADGDTPYRIVQSGTADAVNATESFSLSYPTYPVVSWDDGTTMNKCRINFGVYAAIPANP